LAEWPADRLVTRGGPSPFRTLAWAVNGPDKGTVISFIAVAGVVALSRTNPKSKALTALSRL
jgi:hypothetical protein